MRRITTTVFLGLAAAGLVLSGAACGSPGQASERIPLSVFAASSLTESFGQLEREFERTHPSIDVQLTLAGSQILRLQLEQGATADVLASANEAHMRALAEAGLVTPSQPFAGNELVVIVPPTNPAGIRSLADLPRASRIVIGTDTVPVGAYTRELLERASERLGAGFAAQVRSRVVSEESNVRLVRAKVELGEADAAIVYRTDAAASDRVAMVPIPELDVRARYPIASVTGSSHVAEGEAFIEHVLSEDGRRTLTEHGFVAP
jgi:molybdate transport system substrate-binding protein